MSGRQFLDSHLPPGYVGPVGFRVENGGGTSLDFGGNGWFGAWIQHHLNGDNSTNYPFLINPNGGNVGIGTTNPIGALQVGGTAPVLFMAGNVGIGTLSPTAPLDVNGNLIVESANGRVWGINGLASGQTVHFQYGGDANNEIRNTYNATTQMMAYHGLELTADP